MTTSSCLVAQRGMVKQGNKPAGARTQILAPFFLTEAGLPCQNNNRFPKTDRNLSTHAMQSQEDEKISGAFETDHEVPFQSAWSSFSAPKKKLDRGFKVHRNHQAKNDKSGELPKSGHRCVCRT
jgi:hypothetical protein